MMAGSFWLIVLGLITVDCLQSPETPRQVRTDGRTNRDKRREREGSIHCIHLYVQCGERESLESGINQQVNQPPNTNPQPSTTHHTTTPTHHKTKKKFFMLPLQIPAKYLPLLLYALFALFAGPRLDMACAIALGYAHGYGFVM